MYWNSSILDIFQCQVLHVHHETWKSTESQDFCEATGIKWKYLNKLPWLRCIGKQFVWCIPYIESLQVSSSLTHTWSYPFHVRDQCPDRRCLILFDREHSSWSSGIKAKVYINYDEMEHLLSIGKGQKSIARKTGKSERKTKRKQKKQMNTTSQTWIPKETKER